MNERPSAPGEHEDDDVRRGYRSLPGDEVPPEIDARVLEAARTGLAQRRKSKWLRWSAPIALAASVLVVVAVILDPGARKTATVNDALEMRRTSAPAQQRSYGVHRSDRAAEDSAARQSKAKETPSASAAPRAATEFDAAPIPRSYEPKPIVLDMVPVESMPAPQIDVGGATASAPALGKTVEPEKKHEQQEEQKAAASRAADRGVQENALREAPPSTAITTTTSTRPVVPPLPAPASEPHPPLDVWLRRIRDLQTLGDHERATKEIEALRQAYPGLDVDKELAAIREQHQQPR